MKKISLLAVFSICVFSISFSQYYNNLPVDTITSGQFNDKNPALCNSTFQMSSAPQWLLFERQRNDSSFIIGKRFALQKIAWDSAEVVIASSSSAMPLVHPDLSAAYNSRNTFCAVWQKKENNISSIYFSFYNDSIGHWVSPILLAGDSVSNENPAVRMTLYNSQKNIFTVIWSRKNILLHAQISLGTTPTVDTIAQTNVVPPKFDFCDYDNKKIAVVYVVNADSNRMRLCKTIFSYQPFQYISTDTLPVFVDVNANPRFVQSYFSAALVWIENDEITQKIMGSSLFNFNPQPFSGIVTGKKYDINAFASPHTTLSKTSAFDFLYIDILSYTRENGIDTVLMIHGPSMYYGDTIRSTGYNSSASIGSFICLANGTTYTLVVWESNRTGYSHIYGKLVYNPLGDVKDEEILPYKYLLFQNYPNPFNPTTVISYQLPVNSYVTLKVYDLLGREVAMLVNEKKDAGSYSVTFNASKLSSGVYYARLQNGDNMQLMKMVLVK